MSFDDFLDNVVKGTTTALAAALNLHAVTVDAWRKKGIPKKYKRILKDKFGLSAKAFEQINANCKR